MAFNLGITLDQLYAMSSKEYMGWIKYFNQRPIGFREDHRAAILAQTTYQGKRPLQIKKLFPSLDIINKSSSNRIAKAKAFIGALQAKTGQKVIKTD